MGMLKNILIINLGGIGDILLSIPALKAIRKHYTGSNISMLVAPRSYDLVKDLTFIDNIYIFSPNFRGEFFLRGIFKDLSVLLALRKVGFDLAINMRPMVSKRSASKMKFILNVINPRIKAGRDTEGRGNFFDIKIWETCISQKYDLEYNIDIAEALGVEVADRSIEIKIEEESTNKINEILRESGISANDLLIAVHPGGIPSRRWPMKNFAKAIRGIQERMNCKFIITGGKEEIGLADKLARANGRAINVAGKLSTKELIALIKRCDFFISNDTGPMHLAAALNVPLVAIFGPGDITRYDPRNISKKAVVLYNKVDCAPCTKEKCNSPKCINTILPEEVEKAVFSLLNR